MSTLQVLLRLQQDYVTAEVSAVCILQRYQLPQSIKRLHLRALKLQHRQRTYKDITNVCGTQTCFTAGAGMNTSNKLSINDPAINFCKHTASEKDFERAVMVLLALHLRCRRIGRPALLRARPLCASVPHRRGRARGHQCVWPGRSGPSAAGAQAQYVVCAAVGNRSEQPQGQVDPRPCGASGLVTKRASRPRLRSSPRRSPGQSTAALLPVSTE